MQTVEQHTQTSTLIEALEALSMKDTEFKVLGRLDSLIPKELFHGSISLDRRIADGEITREQHEASLVVIAKCYVPITPGAALRCVDGRGLLGFDPDNPADYEVGPQIQGGSVDVATSRRLTVGVQPGVTLEDDVKQEVETPHPAAPGGHTSVGHEETCDGCGACKGQEAKLGYYQKSEYMTAMRNVVSVLYETAGLESPNNLLADLPQNSANLEGIADVYFAGKKGIIDFMASLRQSMKDAKQVLVGAHLEGSLWLNFDLASTMHSGKVNHVSEGLWNAFGLDVAYILNEYPDEAPVLLADAVATLLNLTDGSLDVVVRLPKSDDSSPVAA